MRTSGSRMVPAPPRPATVNRSVISLRTAPAARRDALSTSTDSAATPGVDNRCTARSTSNDVLPVPGPPSTATGSHVAARRGAALASSSAAGPVHSREVGSTTGAPTNLLRCCFAALTTSASDHDAPTVLCSVRGCHTCVMDDEQVERVRTLLAAVPPGRVTTYGELAAAAGLGSPRMAGRILAEDSADLAWHRVVNASGRTAPHKTTEQLRRLRAEDVPIRDDRVDLAAARWSWPSQLRQSTDPAIRTMEGAAPDRGEARMRRC